MARRGNRRMTSISFSRKGNQSMSIASLAPWLEGVASGGVLLAIGRIFQVKDRKQTDYEKFQASFLDSSTGVMDQLRKEAESCRAMMIEARTSAAAAQQTVTEAQKSTEAAQKAAGEAQRAVSDLHTLLLAKDTLIVEKDRRIEAKESEARQFRDWATVEIAESKQELAAANGRIDALMGGAMKLDPFDRSEAPRLEG